MKTRQNNDMTDSTIAIYAKNKIELLCLIGLRAVNDKSLVTAAFHTINPKFFKDYYILYHKSRILDYYISYIKL